MDERRQLPRWELGKEAGFWLTQRQEFRLCVIEDLNLKGMRVSFDKQLPLEQPVRVSLGLDDKSDLMKLEVDVPWVRPDKERYVYGISFNRIAETDKERLYQYISNNCSKQIKEKWWA
jgi:c-di-GMP-binding flagellar brake protein YcgR